MLTTLQNRLDEHAETLADYFMRDDHRLLDFMLAFRHEEYPGRIWKAILEMEWPERTFRFEDSGDGLCFLCDMIDKRSGSTAADLFADRLDSWGSEFPCGPCHYFGWQGTTKEIALLRQQHEHRGQTNAELVAALVAASGIEAISF